MPDNYDAIIIGSGIGGLTCGAFLSKAGYKTLVLEQHSKIGGYAHSFKRKGFRFESGIHSLAMAPRGLVYHLLRLLGVDHLVKAVSHSSMYSTTSPSGSFVMPAAHDEILPALCGYFPREKDAICSLFKDMGVFYDKLLRPVFDYETVVAEPDTDFISKYYNCSFSDYIKRFTSDKQLQSMLFAPWPFVGSSPAYAPVMFYVLMLYVHFYEGSHYVEGGFSVLADALASVIRSNGGEVLTRHAVTGLRIEEKTVRSVCVAGGKEYRARVVVSNISPYSLHNDLIDEQSRSKIWQRRLRSLRPSGSALALYLGLKKRIPGLEHGVTMWYDTNDHEAVFERVLDGRNKPGDHLVFLKAPESARERTLMLMCFAEMNGATDWKQDKHLWAEAMLDKAEQIVPGLRDAIEVQEIGSPSTFERYTGNTRGALYGFENTRSLYGEAKLPFQTYLPNLYQAGHWGKPGGGIWNVMQNGYSVSKSILAKS